MFKSLLLKKRKRRKKENITYLLQVRVRAAIRTVNRLTSSAKNEEKEIRKQRPDTETKNQKTKWNNDEISRLIDLYEARPCLWDVFTSEHHNREATSKAKAEIEVGYIFRVCFWEKKILALATTVLVRLRTLDFFCYF